MNIFINGRELPCVISCEVGLFARNVRKEYNADGGLLIENMNRKYTLAVKMGRKTPQERAALSGALGSQFAEVRFYSPQEDAQLTRDFFLASLSEEIINQFAGTGEITLSLEER